MDNQLQFGIYTNDVKEWLGDGNLQLGGKEIFLETITPHPWFQEWKTIDQAKLGHEEVMQTEQQVGANAWEWQSMV